MNSFLAFPVFLGALTAVYRVFSPEEIPEIPIQLEITNIQSDKGSILIAVFKDEESFKDENPFRTIVVTKDSMTENKLSTEVSLKPGVYGISVLDDENDNGQMDFNFVGVPKEGFGFADYYHSGLSRPKFEDFKFELKAGDNLSMTAKFRYM